MENVSRRGFVKGAGVAAAAAGLVGASEALAQKAAPADIVWDYECDVAVAGTGGAGITTAMVAADAGSSVIIVEKAPEKWMGGNTRVCMQAFWTPSDVEGAVAYVKEIAGEEHLYGQDDEYLTKFCTYANELPTWFAENTRGCELIPPHASAEYKNAENAWASALSWSVEGQGYMRVWNALYESAARKDNITWMFETPITDILFNEAGEAIGIQCEQAGATINIKAKQGVCLCTGGFENNDEMKANYHRAPSPLAWKYCGTPFNTGDGQIICMKHDIKMWHMNNTTSGCFFGCEIPWVEEEEFKTSCLGCEIAGDYGYILVNKYGKRFMNEVAFGGYHGFDKSPYFYYDGPNLDWTNLPFWLVFDQDAINFGTIGQYSSYDQWLSMIGGYTWSKDLEFEVEQGLALKADTVEELAEKMGVDPAVLAETVSTYNGYAENGVDLDFNRYSGMSSEEKMVAVNGVQNSAMMRPLFTPIYAIKCYPLMVNTQGGPQHDKNRQLMKNDGTLIPRLYSAGECGSIWGWCYQGGANLGETMVAGRIAAEEITKYERWDA